MRVGLGRAVDLADAAERRGRGLRLYSARLNARRLVDDRFLAPRGAFESCMLLDRQRAMKDVALDDRGAGQPDAVGVDGALDAPTDAQVLGNDVALHLRAVTDQYRRRVQLALDATEYLHRAVADDLADNHHAGPA